MVRPSFIASVQERTMNLKEKMVEVIWYNNFSCFLRKIGRFISRLIRWIPVLYRQEEWDYEYIYDILELKMRELRANLYKDTWHESRSVKRSITQIDLCLARLDRFRNWDTYIEIPETRYEEQENGMPLLVLKDPEYDKALRAGIIFEDKNYRKFWQDFINYHQNWWT